MKLIPIQANQFINNKNEGISYWNIGKSFTPDFICFTHSGSKSISYNFKLCHRFRNSIENWKSSLNFQSIIRLTPQRFKSYGFCLIIELNVKKQGRLNSDATLMPSWVFNSADMMWIFWNSVILDETCRFSTTVSNSIPVQRTKLFW